MPRPLIVLALGLSLISCDKPGVDRAASVADETQHHQARHRRHASSAPDEEPAVPLRERLTAATALESPAAREKALAEIAWDALEIEPETAHEAFRRLTPDSPEKIRLIQHYAMRLAAQNLDEALAWAAALETEVEISAATSHIALEIAETDPVRAANLLSESGIEGRDFDVALVQVVQRWAANSPQDAAAWVVDFPPTAARKAGIQAVLEPWLRDDTQAAFNWVQTQQDSTIRQEVLAGLNAAIRQQPESTRDAWLRHASPGLQLEIQQPSPGPES
jgi:hypothetical protein